MIDAGEVATVPPAAPVLVRVNARNGPMLSVSTALLLVVSESTPGDATVAVAVLVTEPLPEPETIVAWTV